MELFVKDWKEKLLNRRKKEYARMLQLNNNDINELMLIS